MPRHLVRKLQHLTLSVSVLFGLNSLGCADFGASLTPGERSERPPPRLGAPLPTERGDTDVDRQGESLDSSSTRERDAQLQTEVDVEEVEEDVSIGGDADAEDSQDGIPRPDGFPRPDTGDCPPGTPCPLGQVSPCFTGLCNGVGECIALPVEGCCDDDDDCSDLALEHPCDEAICADNLCTTARRVGCCADASECDDQVMCTEDICYGGPGGQCGHCTQGCACTVLSSVLKADFGGASLVSEGFSILDYQSDPVSWRLSERRYTSPPTAAWLGHQTCPNYYSGDQSAGCVTDAVDAVGGGPVKAVLITPTLQLPPNSGGYIASWWVWTEVEPGDEGLSALRDLLTIELRDLLTQERWELTDSLSVGKSTEGSWRQMAVDLSPWRGRTVNLRFSFDTIDGDANHYEGVYLDDLSIAPRCAAPCCQTDSDCVDTLGEAPPCEVRACVSLTDGAGTACLTQPSKPGSLCEPCEDDESCADDDPCTADSCGSDGTCSHVVFCCIDNSVTSEGFEADLGAWGITDNDPADGVSWFRSTEAAHGGQYGVWLTNPATQTYAADGPVRIALTHSPLTLPELSADKPDVTVSFSIRMGTEWNDALYVNPGGLDRLSFAVVVSGDLNELWSSDEIEGSTGGQWERIELSLGPYAGQNVSLRFEFDSVDSVSNDFLGVQLDDIAVGQLCP